MKDLQLILISQLLQSTKQLCFSSYFCFFISSLFFIYFPYQILSIMILIMMLLLLLIQHYLHIRIQFDAMIFHHLSKIQNNNLQECLQSLDASLIKLNLIQEDQAGRTLTARFIGCKKLMRHQAILIITQYALLIVLLINH